MTIEVEAPEAVEPSPLLIVEVSVEVETLKGLDVFWSAKGESSWIVFTYSFWKLYFMYISTKSSWTVSQNESSWSVSRCFNLLKQGETVESSWTVIENDKSSWSWSTGDSWTLFSVNSWSVLCKQWQKLLIPFIHFLFNSRWSCLEVLWPSSDRRADHWFEVIYCPWRFLLGVIEHFTSTSAFLCSPAVLMGGLTLQGLVVGHLSQCLIDGEDWQWNWLESKQKPLRGIEAFSTRYPQHRFFVIRIKSDQI